MIVPDVVNAISRIEIEDTSAVGGVEFGSLATPVFDVHLHDFEQSRPLRIDVTLVTSDGVAGVSNLLQHRYSPSPIIHGRVFS